MPHDAARQAHVVERRRLGVTPNDKKWRGWRPNHMSKNDESGVRFHCWNSRSFFSWSMVWTPPPVCLVSDARPTWGRGSKPVNNRALLLLSLPIKVKEKHTGGIYDIGPILIISNYASTGRCRYWHQYIAHPFAEDTQEFGLTKKTMLVFWYRALATQILCLWPPLRLMPWNTNNKWFLSRLWRKKRTPAALPALQSQSGLQKEAGRCLAGESRRRSQLCTCRRNIVRTRKKKTNAHW